MHTKGNTWAPETSWFGRLNDWENNAQHHHEPQRFEEVSSQGTPRRKPRISFSGDLRKRRSGLRPPTCVRYRGLPKIMRDSRERHRYRGHRALNPLFCSVGYRVPTRNCGAKGRTVKAHAAPMNRASRLAHSSGPARERLKAIPSLRPSTGSGGTTRKTYKSLDADRCQDADARGTAAPWQARLLGQIPLQLGRQFIELGSKHDMTRH